MEQAKKTWQATLLKAADTSPFPAKPSTKSSSCGEMDTCSAKGYEAKKTFAYQASVLSQGKSWVPSDHKDC